VTQIQNITKTTTGTCTCTII